MVTAIIMLSVEKKHINQVAEKLAAIDGLSEVYSVSGSYDIAAIARVQTNDQLSELVTKHLAQIDYILKTETMLAFQAYSKHDLEGMFSVGV
ncbi:MULTISPECIES: Lrp/AsnC family transcriptional regulator [Marinomonas]|uniref:Lrp/AsnC ligand binding domain-containing protein n=1 Tax=Marinomonas arctica TaxID=383750 RepID=A0A7H1J722_9GAMM|nr:MULTISPECIES: Lrp/AsnC ligand binding domain-containing protein [Marinomonas]MCS7485693.1 AsnC family transcriptional regulator [Marinomonas sp. BSi20414]QNT06288.1 Lrp/AsnC ligand binding domain-containing protein [Marinomonas arctica]GGN28842.1 AsnC family transcriptional regulator [Marinomonas arctica]